MSITGYADPAFPSWIWKTVVLATVLLIAGTCYGCMEIGGEGVFDLASDPARIEGGTLMPPLLNKTKDMVDIVTVSRETLFRVSPGRESPCMHIAEWATHFQINALGPAEIWVNCFGDDPGIPVTENHPLIWMYSGRVVNRHTEEILVSVISSGKRDQ